MKRAGLILLLFIIFFAIVSFSSKAFAVTVNVLSYPLTITQDMFTLTASISGAGNGTNYLRVDLYKEGTTNYFGETYNGTDFYSGSDYHQYLPITISGSSWSGSIQGSIGSPSLSQYDGNGVYRLRLRRYTSGGSTTASEADASSVIVTIITPSPTPTAMPTATPIPPTNTVAPTATLKPTSTPTPKPTVTPTNSPSKSPSLASNSGAFATESAVLGATDSGDDGLVAGIQDQKDDLGFNPFALILIVGGILLLIACGILLFYNYKRRNLHAESTHE